MRHRRYRPPNRRVRPLCGSWPAPSPPLPSHACPLRRRSRPHQRAMPKTPRRRKLAYRRDKEPLRRPARRPTAWPRQRHRRSRRATICGESIKYALRYRYYPAMNFARQTSHLLHEEHRANLDLLGRVENALGRAPRGAAAGQDENIIKLLVALRRQVEHGRGAPLCASRRRSSFTRLADAGDGDHRRVCCARSTRPSAPWPPNCCRWRAAAAAGYAGPGRWPGSAAGGNVLETRRAPGRAHPEGRRWPCCRCWTSLLDDDTDRELDLRLRLRADARHFPHPTCLPDHRQPRSSRPPSRCGP
jgi:hypothetical protein